MSARVFVGATLFGAAMLVGCKEQIPIPATPTTIRIVSGSNQSADLSSALDSALVVQVLDAAARPVAGVVLTWTATSGTLSAATTPTSADGRASVRWTLGSTIGTHVATVSSTQVAGVSVSFLATNGATISGVVSPAGGNPFANFSMSPSRASRMSLSSVRRITRRLSPNHVVVGFRDGALGVAASGSTAYQSLATARQTGTRMQQSVARLSRTLPIADARFSPAMLAARVRVLDTTDVERVMAELRKDADVAWVERDEIVSIRDGAPRPSSAAFLDAFANRTPGTSASMVAPRYPNDPTFYAQYWAANMIDLPKAWSITTGSPNVTVAVIDMGIRFDHADIAANLTNDGYDFVSEIGYGSTQQICGGGEFDTIDGDGDGPDADPTDPDDLAYDARFDCWERQELGDHGLWTAGIIGSVGNDAVGISGVNWGVKIRPVRVLGITGDGTNFDIAQGILYSAGLAATGAGGAPVQAPTRAQIINLSLGGPSPSNVLLSAVNAAFNAGSLVVASAGNDGLDFPNYPAAYPNVMGVSAIGQDGALATYSNAGTFISVAAPGGDFRLDGNGGGGIVGPGWNFVTGRPTFLFGYGTSAAAPYVAGVAALILAQTPTLTPSALRTRIEQFAMRPAGTTRSDTHGWGIVNAYNSITQTSGPLRKTFVRLVDPTSGNVVRTTTATLDGSFTFARVTNGAYFVQAGDDESGDNTLGIPGRRLGWYGGSGAPTAVNVNGNSQALAFSLGMPMEVEPNNDTQGANILVPGGYVVGNITTPDVRDVYRVVIATPGVYTFETTGLVGSCGMGVELDTVLLLQGQDGTNLVQNNDFTSPTSRFCSRMQPTLTAGVYYVTVTGTSGNGLALHGRYRLQVRAGS